MQRNKTLSTGILYWLGIPSLVTLAGYLPGELATHSTLLILYFCSVLYCSLQADQNAVIACAFVSFFMFNYFHTDPQYSLLMHNLNEFTSSLVFVGFAALAGSISTRIKSQVISLERQKEFLNAQIMLAHKCQDFSEEVEILPLLNDISRNIFSSKIRFILEPTDSFAGASHNGFHLNWQTPTAGSLDPDMEAMLINLKEQVNSAFDRMSVRKALKIVERKGDEERLRSALLSSVSHDLKTPLLTMIGAATSLRYLDASLSANDKVELVNFIIGESRRLESYIQNLLDMTRLGYGELPLHREWVSINEIYHVVMKRISQQFPDNHIQLKASKIMPPLNVHATLIEQALFNAFENAIKAGGESSVILVEVTQEDDRIVIYISDHGPGLPQAEWEAVFDQFYTFSQGDCYEKGTGLGLSICRSIFKVHMGDALIIKPKAGFNHCLMLSLPLNIPGKNTDKSS